MRKNSMSPDFKKKLIKEYLAGRSGYKSIAEKYGIGRSTLWKWIRQYESMGAEAFIRDSNKSYTVQLKESAVVEYLETSASLNDICRKYKILSTCTLTSWIKKYNSHEEFKSVEGERIMIKGRKTTYEERIEIVAYCTEHDDDYAGTAEHFNVSYQQVYSWMRKYYAFGPDGLVDRRGRTKPEAEMSELERLRAENRILKAENRRKELENLFLKKVDEIERRRS